MRPISCGRSTVPRSTTIPPVSTSSPRIRTLRPLSNGADAHTVAGALDDFLRIDGIGAGRHRRAGHDAQRLTGAQRLGEHGARRRSPTTSSSRRPAGGMSALLTA